MPRSFCQTHQIFLAENRLCKRLGCAFREMLRVVICFSMAIPTDIWNETSKANLNPAFMLPIPHPRPTSRYAHSLQKPTTLPIQLLRNNS